MANPAPMEFPIPPSQPNVAEMHAWMLSMYNFMKQTMLNGVQAPFFSQAQLDAMTDLSQAGKLFFNNDTGKFNGGEVSGGALDIREFTTT